MPCQTVARTAASTTTFAIGDGTGDGVDTAIGARGDDEPQILLKPEPSSRRATALTLVEQGRDSVLPTPNLTVASL